MNKEIDKAVKEIYELLNQINTCITLLENRGVPNDVIMKMDKAMTELYESLYFVD